MPAKKSLFRQFLSMIGIGSGETQRPRGAQRIYSTAVPSRLNAGFPGYNTSADAQLVDSLRNLRSRSRELIRDSAFAENAQRVIKNNVVGTGVKLQGIVQNQKGGLSQRINDAIEDAFAAWSCAEYCHTGGSMHFSDMERMIMGQVFEAGEVFIRIHRRSFGGSPIPFALEIVEPERIADSYPMPGPVGADTVVRMGIEVDEFCRPVAYWIRDLHPGDIRYSGKISSERAERVLANDIIHLHIVDRWPQTRGIPWMHAVAGKLLDMNGYSEAEIVAARGAANFLGVLETPDDNSGMSDEQPDGTSQMPTEPGTWFRTLPGEKANFIAPNRPNSALDPFMRFMLREVAAGCGVSYESLSRDYSKGTYSSNRLALLDDRDVWRTLQAWIIRQFRIPLHKQWMAAAMLAGAIPEIDSTQYWNDMDRFNAVYFRPRGWSWIDPTKEVAAFKEAVKAGFTTNAAVIGATSGGEDLEDVVRQRSDELSYLGQLELHFDTSPEVYVPAETRGQMLMVDGKIVTAASQAPPPGSVAPGGGAVKPAVSDAPVKVTVVDEPADAEDTDDPEERILELEQENVRLVALLNGQHSVMRRLRVIGGNQNG